MGGVVDFVSSIFGGDEEPPQIEQPKPVADLTSDSAKKETKLDTTSQTIAQNQSAKKKGGKIKNPIQISTATTTGGSSNPSQS